MLTGLVGQAVRSRGRHVTEELPFFVYGTLKPGQLAYRQVEALVESTVEAELHGYELLVRDGLPGIRKVPYGAHVEGVVLFPNATGRDEFLKVVARFEPTKDLYTRPEPVTVETDDGPIQVLTHLMKSPGKSHAGLAFEGSAWGLADDPLFAVALPVIREQILALHSGGSPDSDSPEFWRAFLPMQGLLLSLCGILERYLTLTYGIPDDPRRKSSPEVSQGNSINSQLTALGASSEGMAAVKQCGIAPVEVYGSKTLDKISAKEAKAWAGWYAVRSNAVHRGKAAHRDLPLVTQSVFGLHNSLRLLLAGQLPELKGRWARVDETPDYLLELLDWVF